MDFIFMLTHGDKTVANCIEVFEKIRDIGVSHIGFKDLGVDKDMLAALTEQINAAGVTSYLEVVSTTDEGVRNSIRTAAEIGVDRVLGGQDVEFALDVLRGSGTSYYPFPGRPVGHPTELQGTAEEVEADCRRMRAAGCPGVDLLAYRATEADPLDLVRAARTGLGDGYLIVAGSVDSPARIRHLAQAGADAFTIGTAVFEGVFAPGDTSLVHQCREILAACEEAA
ncbi:MAG: 4-hydroxythreonine-4-phosphate dehydrogenase [Hyphomicrobiales bacterium]